MSVTEYYDEYWSPAGFNPLGGQGLAAEVAAIYRDVVRPGMRVIDLGCGDGATSGPALTALGAKYHGVDISPPAVEAALAAGLDARVIADAADLPFEDRKFELGVCIEVLEHLFRPDRAALELARVLRPGAVTVVTVPNVAFWRRRADLALLGRWNPLGDDRSVDEPWRDPHIRFFSVASLARMLELSGFVDVRVGGHGGSVLGALPGLRRLAGPAPSGPYRAAQRRVPGLLGSRLHALARRA